MLIFLLCTVYGEIPISYIPESKTPPPQRFYSLIAHCEVRNSFIVFGGSNGEGNYNDIWEYSIETSGWREINPLSYLNPEPRRNFGGFVRKNTTDLYVFGGNTDIGPDNDLWVLDLDFMQWRKVFSFNPPSPRSQFGYKYYEEDGFDYLFVTGGVLIKDDGNAVYRLNVSSLIWDQFPGDGEGPGSVQCPVVEYYDRNIYLTTGLSDPCSGSLLFIYDLSNCSWSIHTNESDAFECIFLAQGTVYQSYFYVFFGWLNDVSEDSPNVFRIDLALPNSTWEVVLTDSNLALDAFASVQLNDSLYIFSGYRTQTKEISNQFMALDLVTLEAQIISPSIVVPVSRYGHSMHVINGKFYIFDGMGTREFFTEVSYYDPVLDTWNNVTSIGEVPSARYRHAADSQGESLAIWGGKDQVGALNDLYIMNVLTGSWIELKPSSEILPSAASGACMVLNIPYIYVYGGVITSGISTELWRFEMGNNVWVKLGNDKPIAYANCFLENGIFFVSFGSGNQEEPNNVIRAYDLAKNSWFTYHEHEVNDTDSAQAVQVFIKGVVIRVGGEQWMLTPSNLIDISGPGNNYTVLDTIKEYIYSAAFVYFNTSLYIFGGNSYLGLNLRKSIASGLFIRIDLKDICASGLCKAECSKGTFISGDTCELCKAGTYSNDTGKDKCEPCPAGTYSPYPGATSQRQCYPCSDGTYSTLTGSAQCRDCPIGKFCPVGTVVPLEQHESTVQTSMQPMLYQAEDYKSIVLYYESSAVSFFFFMLAIIFSSQLLRDKIIHFDIFVDKHDFKLNEKLMLRKTYCGGFFSLLFILVLLIFVGNAAMTFQYGNIQETKDLVPLVVLQSDDTKLIASFVRISVVFYSYGGTCTLSENGPCTSYLRTFLQNIVGSITIECKSLSQRNCLVEFLCNDCEVKPGANVQIQLTEKVSYSTGIGITVSSDSSIPNQPSQIQVSIMPGLNQVYIGSVPSEFFFTVTPSLFTSESSQWPKKQTGYHISLSQSPTNGSMFKTTEIPSSSYLKANVYLDISNEAMLTARFFKQETGFFLSNLMGSIFGLLGAVGGAMKSVEKNYVKFKEKKENSGKSFQTKDV